MKAIHLAIICGTLNPDTAAGTQTIALANGLTESGYRVTLLASQVNEADIHPSITLIDAGINRRVVWLGMIRYTRWLTKTLLKVSPDHTISMLSTIPAEILVVLSGTVRARQQARQALSTGIIEAVFQRLNSLRPSALLLRLLERRAMSNSTVQTFIAMSPLIKTDIADRLPNTQVRIEVAHATLLQQQADQNLNTQIRQQLGRAWGLNEDSYWIVLPFADAQLDGFESMLRAFKPLVEQGVETVLLLAGPTRYTHMAWISELGLRERVRFVGATTRLGELMTACDLVVNPTSYDPLGLAVRQAVALSKPTITTNANAAADQVPEARGGVLPAPAQPGALLEALLQQHALWQQGEPRPTETISEETQAPNLAEIIDRLLQGQHTPA